MLIGNLFLIHIALGLIYFGIGIAFSIVGSRDIEITLRRSVIDPQVSKRNQFQWLLYIGTIEVIFLIVYNETVTFMDIEQTRNYFNCLYEDEYIMKDFYLREYSVYEIIGRPFTFEESAVAFALLGAIFGISYTFRHVTILRWYRGPVQKRVIRALIALSKLLLLIH
jgi:hypothetical protein